MMRKHKNIVLLALMLVFNLLVCSVAWAAPVDTGNATSEYRTVFQGNEITDADQLYNMAKSGKTSREMPMIPAKIANSDEVSRAVPTYSTTQLLKIEEKNDGTKKETYVTNYFADVSLDYIEDQYREAWDSSISVRAYSTVYYSIVTSGGVDYYDLSSVSGGWYRADTSVSLSNRHVIISNQGFILGGGISTTVQHQYPTSNTFSYTCPSSWPAVAAYSNYFPGCSTSVTLTRGGSTWTLTLTNNLPATL